MHERQAAVVVSILIFSIMYVTESFADTPQCDERDATQVGTNGNDIIRGSSGDDVIVALGGNDIVYGMGGNDVICGGDGNDRLYGNSGNDILIGQEGFDSVNGGKGLDTCDFTDEHGSSHHSDDEGNDCEIQYKETPVNNDDLQNQINDLKNQISNIILGFIKWDNIQGIPEDIANGDDDTLGKLVCNIDQVAVFNGKSWVCKNPPQPNEDTLTKLDCNADEIAKWDGNAWQCSNDIAFSASPIFFHHFALNGGEMQWAGITDASMDNLDRNAIVIPTSGILSNLYAKLGDFGDNAAPSAEDKYTLTLIKNKVDETALTCSITGLADSCNSGEIKISVNAGDEILLRAESSSNAPFAIIKSSVLFKGP
jgi:hypothetical protein